MLNEDKKILKYNYGEKSLKVPFINYTDLECLHEVKIIFKNLIQKEKISIRLLVIQYLQVVCLIQQKLNLIVTR